MSKKARNPRSSSSSSAATPQPGRSARPAGYDYWPDLALSRSRGFPSGAQTGANPSRRRVTAPVTIPTRPARPARQRPLNPPQGVFGGWELPPYLLSSPAALKPAIACAKRSTRREVLFATRSTGKGSHSPKKQFTNKGCK